MSDYCACAEPLDPQGDATCQRCYRKVRLWMPESWSVVGELVEPDMVNQPPHYKTGGIETIDFIEAKALPYHLGNVVKYIARAQHKGSELEDLKKARWYLTRYIEKLEAA